MVVPKNLTITFTKDLQLDTQDDIAKHNPNRHCIL
jgi:hypothetical protein